MEDSPAEGGPASFLTLGPETPVLDRFGLPVGEVDRVLIAGGFFFDGIIVNTRVGSRFVDAPEVAEITGSSVRLSIGCHDVEHPGEPRVLGAHSARRGSRELSDEDRDAVIEALKVAYVRDALDTEELAAAVDRAHRATSLEELEGLLPTGQRFSVEGEQPPSGLVDA